MKSKKQILVLVTLMCLLVSMIPMKIKATEATEAVETTEAAEPSDATEDATEYVTFTESIRHKNEPLEGAIIELFNAETGDSLGSSEIGTITVQIPKNIMMKQTITLPDGYQFMFETEKNDDGQAVCEVICQVDDDYDWTYDVTNPSIDGVLTANKSVLEVQVGDSIDLRGAYDLNYDDFQLNLVKDGTSTRAFAYVTSLEGDFLEWQSNTSILTALKAGTTTIRFLSEGGAAGTVQVVITEKTVSEEPVVLSDVSADQENTIESEGGALSITGKQNMIPAGSSFSRTQVISGDIFDKAKEVLNETIKSVLGFEVYEMDLKDPQGGAITQLADYVSVTMDIPSTLTIGNDRTIAVYRMETDGSLTECTSSIQGGKITFLTNHFSTYLFVSKPITEVADNSDNTSTDVSNSSNDTEVTSTTNTDTVNQTVVPPQTGESVNLIVTLLIMALGIGMVTTAIRRQTRI
jgi:hypothetical protein